MIIRHHGIRLVTGAVATSLAAGGASVHAQERSFTPGRWVEIARVDESRGHLFMKPDLLAMSGDVVLVFDNGSQSLTCFSVRGERRWEVGRKGGGPGEFVVGADLAEDGRGGAYVLDPSNARVTHIGASGKVEGMLSGIKELHRITRSHDELIGAPLSGALLGTVGSDGALSDLIDAPAKIAGLNPLVRENLIATASDGHVVVVHRWSTEALVVDLKTRNVRSFALLNPLPFPEVRQYNGGPGGQFTITRIDPKAIPVGRAIATQGDTLYVIDFRTADGDPAIDEYEIPTGRYARSRRSPALIHSFRRTGDLLVGIVEDPLPALVIWRWAGTLSP